MKAKTQVQKPASVSMPKHPPASPAETYEEVLPDIATQLGDASQLNYNLGAVNSVPRSQWGELAGRYYDMLRDLNA
jgi:hypothetical protein